MKKDDSGIMSVVLSVIGKLRNELLLFAIAMVALIGFLLSLGIKIPSELVPLIYALSLLPPIAVFIAIRWNPPPPPPPPPPPAAGTGPGKSSGVRVFGASDARPFVEELEESFRRAQRVVLIGTGLNILGRDPLRNDLFARAARGECTVEIFLANPFGPAVETRLIEEECGDVKPQVGRIGLIRRIESLIQDLHTLHHPAGITLRLFSFYPTFALIVVDDQYHFYPYGFARLGNFSPVLSFNAAGGHDEPPIPFLAMQYERTKAASVNAESVLRARRRQLKPSPDLCSFALYYIPPQDSALYAFGTKVLGYDVYSRARDGSPYAAYVAGARDFGFHMTLCDVLYFPNEHELRAAIEEVRFLAQTLRPFRLGKLHVAADVPYRSAISITATEPTGVLEALQHELVHRVYRRAIASNYSLGTAHADRDSDSERAGLMIERYTAPYILGRFVPHFTLCASVAAAEIGVVARKLTDEFRAEVGSTSIEVGRLAVMRPRSDGPGWEIGLRHVSASQVEREEILLG